MIPKIETKSSVPADFRPISSCVGKVVERVVKNRLSMFLESKNLIVKEQSGFRNKRGTAYNLLFMSQNIRQCILGIEWCPAFILIYLKRLIRA